MLYEWLAGYADQFQVFNLFNYLTFRTGGALMTSMLIAFILGPRMITMLRSKQGKGQPIRLDGPEGHIIKKAGTPTMGGLLILLSVSLSTLLWGDLRSPFLWTVFLVTLGYGLIGFYDDYLKVSRQNPKFGCLVIVGASNAVNLTDGLDGLAIVPVMIACMSFLLIAYFVGNSVFSNYLGVPYVPGASEVCVFLGAIVGAGLGFLWYNAPPAMVFMGDTGSLALGGALGTTAVAIKHEIVLAVIGGLFVLEAVSVIVQVASFKLTGKRVFRMAPIHHHYEKKGWAEPTIVIRFWIIAIILALIGLSTLKLR